MSTFLNIEKKTYSVVINSADKLTGSNNNGTYQINWDDFLPREYQQYKLCFSFQTAAGQYKDGTYTAIQHYFSSLYISLNNLGRSYSFETRRLASSYKLGVARRDIQISGTATSSSNTLACSYLSNPPRTIDRPNQNIITIQIYNSYNNSLMLDTNKAATTILTDMSNWTLFLEFIPIEESRVKPQDIHY